MNPSDLLISFSKALYSQWFFHKPSHCLFDAGEGVATTLGKRVTGIRYLFLSHGHEDHIAGISNLVNIRNLTSGEEKPLSIYYPMHDQLIAALFEYIEKKQKGLLRYPLYVQPLEPGDEVEIEGTGRPTRVRAIESHHARARLCLGFEVEEERKMQDFATGQSVHKLHPTLYYSGDGTPVDYLPEGRVDIAIHEATFLERDAGEAARRVDHRHATVEQAVDWAASLDVKTLIMCHISDRYHTDEIAQIARESKERSQFRGEIYIARNDKILPIDSSRQDCGGDVAWSACED
jgi:ribonuclease Z